MNYHARANLLEQFMNRALLIMSTTLSCLVLTGCSWMSQEPCSGKNADLSNPACVVQSKQTYRDNDSRWFCIGHLEAKDWSCASSLEEAQTKHDAMTPSNAELGRVPTKIDALESVLGFEPAPMRRRNELNTLLETVAQRTKAEEDEVRLAVAVSKDPAPESPVFAERLPKIADVQSVGGDFESVHAAASTSEKNREKQALNDGIMNSALAFSAEATTVTAEPATPYAMVLETQSLAAVADKNVGPKVRIVETSAVTTTVQKPLVSPEPGVLLALDIHRPETVLPARGKDKPLQTEAADSRIRLAAVNDANELEAQTIALPAAIVAMADKAAVPALIEAPKPVVASSEPGIVAAVESPAIAIQTELPLITQAEFAADTVAIKGIEAPVVLETVQEGLAEAQNADPLPELPIEMPDITPAMVAVAASGLIAAEIDTPIALVEAPKGVVIPAVEMPATEPFTETPPLTTAMPKPRALTISETPTPTRIETEQLGLADSRIANALSDDPVERPEPASAPAVNLDMPSVMEVPLAVDAVSPAGRVSALEMPAIENEAPPLELADAVLESAVEPAPLDLIAVPTIVEQVQPSSANTQSDAPSMAIEGLAAQAVTTIVRPDVATIASEIVIPATAPFPAGTTLAEVYTDHVKRSEQLPAGLQTLGPKGALPMPSVASTAPRRRIDPQPTPVQKNRAPNRSIEQIARSTQAAPFVAAVASAAKLGSIPDGVSGLDYASMESPATSGDGTYDYFMDLPADDFAIQLIAQKSLPSIRTFAATVKLEDPLVLKTPLMKRPLYVLVLDTFNDIQLASDAKRAWMVQYDNGIEPWIRTVGSLQKTMQPIGPMD